jgi:hypothetical protein
LDSARSELNRLEHALTATVEREQRGRRLLAASVQTGQLPDRQAAMEETHSAGRHAEALGPRIEAKGDEVLDRHEKFLFKRVERRQAETLIIESEAREAIEAERRSQQSIDEWYSSRLYREGADAEASRPSTAPE